MHGEARGSGLVMQIVHQFPCYGAENFVTSLSAELARLGIPVVVLTVREGAQPAIDGVAVVSARRGSSADLGFFWRMVALIRAHRPAIVHTHGYHGKLWGRWAAALAGVPAIVHTEHNSDLRANPLVRTLNAVANSRTAQFITFSERLAELLVEYDHVSRERIAIVPNGVPAPRAGAQTSARIRLEFGVPTGARLLLHVGRLTALKNQELAIRALERLRESDAGAGYRLLFAGLGEDEERLRRLCEQLHVAAAVQFLGYRTDIDELMRASHALVVTSKHEAMPLAIMQAMYANVPVISTPWNGVGELLDDGTYGFVAGDFGVDAFARAIVECFTDPLATRRVAARAFACARERFDIELSARRHAALYGALLAHPGSYSRGWRRAS